MLITTCVIIAIHVITKNRTYVNNTLYNYCNSCTNNIYQPNTLCAQLSNFKWNLKFWHKMILNLHSDFVFVSNRKCFLWVMLVLGCKLCLGQFLNPPATLSVRYFCHTKNLSNFFHFQKYGNSWKYRNFWGKMKFKTRLVAGNSIWLNNWLAKIRSNGPLSLLELSYKMFLYPPPPKKKEAFWFGVGR